MNNKPRKPIKCLGCNKVLWRNSPSQLYCGKQLDTGSCSYKHKKKHEKMSNKLICTNKYSNLKISASARNLKFSLKKEDFRKLLKLSCYYCGEEANTIDRKNNSRGYTKSNSVKCCSECNHTKWTYDLDKLLLIKKKLNCIINKLSLE